MMLDAAAALVAKKRTVAGRAMAASLCDVGYCSVGVDEGWEGCGQGANGTQHAKDGTPTIDAAFPDTEGMVAQIHSMGLKAGWYLNGCKCGERTEKTINYEGDIKSLHNFDFDGVKIDGCGRQRNQTLYAALMQASGRNYTIENCHWGDCTSSDDSSCPTEEWCPFNWYRSSGDINSGAQSWLSNLQTTIRFQDYDHPLSVPGCWAYPDMLEVGRVQAPAEGAFYSWNRAHFGAWCITSSPLILGLELTDANLDPVLDIITNEDAIAVNQEWAGHPGMMVETLVAPPVPYSPSGAVVPSNSAGDIDAESPASVGGGPGDTATSGTANIRSGSPGQTSIIRIGTGLVGAGHKLDSVSMQFRYVAGYTGPGTPSTLKVVVLDMASDKVLATVWSSGPLGNYSWDHFKAYSPPIEVKGTGLGVPTDSAVVLAFVVTNNQRNLQIPIDDKANGFNVHVAWAGPTDITAPPTVRRGAGSIGPLAGLFGTGQLWAKPLLNGAASALLINHSPDVLAYTLRFKSLNLTAGSYRLHDIWMRSDNGTVSDGSVKLTVPPYDSTFVKLTPV